MSVSNFIKMQLIVISAVLIILIFLYLLETLVKIQIPAYIKVALCVFVVFPINYICNRNRGD